MDASVEMRSSSFSSNTYDIQITSLKDEEDNISSGKKAKAFEEKLPSSTKILCRKSPRGLGPKATGQGDEEYNKEGEDMNNNDENEEEEEDTKKE